MKKRIYIVLTILLIIIGSTFAYYASNYSGVVTTKSKTFGFNVYKIINTSENVFSDIDLYDTALVHNVKGEEKYIVPGDYGEFIIKVDSIGSEVKIKYDIVLNGENLPTNMKFYLDSEKLDRVELNPLTISGILNLNEEKEHTIYWEWPYDSGENNNLDYEFQGKTFNISVDITGRQGMETEYAINYIGFDNSTQYPSVINKDDEIIIDMSKYNYTSLNLKQGENDLSIDTHYTYENGILKLHNIIDDVTITNLTSFCTRYKEITNLRECLIATDYSNFRKDKSLENAKKNIESKIADFTKTEPYLSYTEDIQLNVTNNNVTASPTTYYCYTTSKPTFNTVTGYHNVTNTKMGSIEEIKNNNGYTCLYTWDATSCPNIYNIKSYNVVDNQIRIIDYDKYTYTVDDDYSSKAGLYAINDEDTINTNQKSYYYRGEVNNNWVSFGGFYWRILRINGDGSIRMMYSGTKENHTGSGAIIGYSKFNNNYQVTTYAGYMYNDDDLEIATYPSSTQNNLNGYITYSKINLGTNYYFTNTRPTCDTSKKTCMFTCKLGENCQYTKWSELNINYDKTDSMSTSTIWKYTNDYKYTCFDGENVINNNDGSKTISCMLTMEIMGVVGNSNIIDSTRAVIKYYGLFSPSYELSVANKTDSVIKTVVDKWYKENIYDKNLENYIVNQTFCNDRSLNYGNGYSRFTIYNSYYRATSYNPSLMCLNQNDKFILKVDSLSTVKGILNHGNNALDYPVGLITVDEVMLAGGFYERMNSKYYISTDYNFWTMSPGVFNTDINSFGMMSVRKAGIIGCDDMSLSLGVHPVINLRADAIITGGSGTVADPYVIK